MWSELGHKVFRDVLRDVGGSPVAVAETDAALVASSKPAPCLDDGVLRDGLADEHVKVCGPVFLEFYRPNVRELELHVVEHPESEALPDALNIDE